MEFTISKKSIDENDELLKNTFFALSKETQIGNTFDNLQVDKDIFISYQLLSLNYDLKTSIDKCLIDNDKMICNLCIYLYSIGVKFENILNIIKNNKYFSYFIKIYLEDNELTKEIIDVCIDLHP